jgi:hypothetical protein
MRRHAAILGITLFCTAAAGCDESLSELAGPTPNLGPTFSAIQREIFENNDSGGARPACVQCHNDNGRVPAGFLNLENAVAYDNLIGRNSQIRPDKTRVVPGNSTASYLIHKLNGGPDIAGARMPLNGQPLSPGQMAIIRAWIDLGAPNN